MSLHRVIPCLLLSETGLVKTVRFSSPKYLGDPINIVKIFNEKEVDEIVFLDITATPVGKPPPFSLLEKVAGEAFMPLAYGGGIRKLSDVKTILGLGFEKVVINTAAVDDPSLLSRIADFSGSQSVVVAIDAARKFFGGCRIFTHGGRRAGRMSPAEWAGKAEKAGAGEILLNSIERDGRMTGYDLDLIRPVTAAVGIPVVACGGAGTLDDLVTVIRAGGASAAAAGSMFVFQGPHRAVLISYPDYRTRERLFLQK
jgi:cyclase